MLECNINMREYIKLSTKIFDLKKPKDYQRVIVFIIRSIRNNRQMKDLINFFEIDSLRRDIAIAKPFIFEQATRYLFYYNSTFLERMALIKAHFLFFAKQFTEEALRHIYLGKGITLWEDQYQGETLSLNLHFDGGHRKEGLMTIVFKMREKLIYQIIFWVAPDKNGKLTAWIGALQSSPGGLKIIRDLTKHFFGYRPKNLILHALRIFTNQLAIEGIYAVSNRGFYANNHIRIDRKLKTSLDEFWKETGGNLSSDPRFFELPIIERRKELKEVESHKRNLYRKRFAAIDEIDEKIKKALTPYLKNYSG